LPAGIGGPGEDVQAPLVIAGCEVSWLQPFPGSLLDTQPLDPAAIVSSRASVRLAFVAAPQRAVLLLRDVLGWRAAEVADLLGTTTAAVNSKTHRQGAAAPGRGRDSKSPPATRSTTCRQE
jgi:RNA polymerase sigma-70 factor, ECF subfamily